MISLDNKKVVLGMSGGVDSSVALMLLKNAGYEVVGVSLKYNVYKCSKRRENVCCSDESFKIAKKVCNSFGFEHEILNVSKEFDNEVIKYFSDELKDNRTPSPCVFCNPRVKFKALFNYADKIGANFVATGHYAKIVKSEFESKEQYLLMRPKDKTKDQTYSLSFLNKSLLSRIIFPLADLEKKEIYELAKENQVFSPYQKIKQSQDFCFLASDELDGFIKNEIKPMPGPIVNDAGGELGSHDGLSHFTLGQRKKIGLSGGPYYVVEKKLPNILVVSTEIEKAFSNKAKLDPFNELVDLKSKSYQVKVKSRSSELLHDAQLVFGPDGVELSYAAPEVILVPGQVAVLYIGEICIGSGVICSK